MNFITFNYIKFIKIRLRPRDSRRDDRDFIVEYINSRENCSASPNTTFLQVIRVRDPLLQAGPISLFLQIFPSTLELLYFP